MNQPGMGKTEAIGVVGLGYVGLPLAVALARKYPVIGLDINQQRVEQLRNGVDLTREVDPDALASSSLRYTSDVADLADVTMFIVTVPTPVDEKKVPDLTPMISASKAVGRVLKQGDVVVYESTVYPGVTREVCGPILEQVSGLTSGTDFRLAYSPERINPGDKVHTVEKIIKVVSGQDDETLERVAAVYESVIEAGVHRAPSIEVAEAAKVIENTQRDLNIALMNELSLIFDRLGIRTLDVLEAAGTKWNFLPFRPGLVGGHCIGVDPYYLTQRAQEVGYYPEVILSGRRVNDGMGPFVAQKTVKLMARSGRSIHGATVGVLGLTFKENVPDLRNSRVPDIIRELEDFGIRVLVHDPYADPAEAQHEYGVELVDLDRLRDLDGLLIVVAHDAYAELGPHDLRGRLRPDGVVVDVKSAYTADQFDGLHYWSL